MYKVSVNNCNNIKHGTVDIEEGQLNIKYGINGTGKTTIAKAVQYSKDGDKIKELQSYYSDNSVSISIAPELGSVEIFNEDFVNQFVFLEREVIKNSFEVFLKTKTYDQKKASIDKRLYTLKAFVIKNSEITTLKEILKEVCSKFSCNTSGGLKKTGTLKSILEKQNIFNIPSELEMYKPFFANKENNVSWVDWVNKGMVFDIENCCPYCAEIFDVAKHRSRKNTFRNNYKKADAKNLVDMVSIIDDLQPYLTKKSYSMLIKYIKEEATETDREYLFTSLYNEAALLLSKFEAIDVFGEKKILLQDIGKLEKIIEELFINIDGFNLFGDKRITNIWENINSRIGELQNEVKLLKKEMGELKGLLNATIQKSQTDINTFLKTAGINYELSIEAEDEENSKAVLQQCFSEDKTEVDDIKRHLSWGEKNAFALVLFMYYAHKKNPDLIILDDPISSFDLNKKYAIMHRMFKFKSQNNISLAGRTVLLLTHDFEPIIDFCVLGKLDRSLIMATYIWNDKGIVDERRIDPDVDIKLIYAECRDIAKNSEVNHVSRIAFLRKLSELCGRRGAWDIVYSILSCLVHGKKSVDVKCHDGSYKTMSDARIAKGEALIKKHIPDFDYVRLSNDVYTKENIKKLYKEEQNPYFKVQLFRALCELLEGKSLFANTDEGWLKFIDETYHVENDYLYYLDIMKFNVIPEYIFSRIEEKMASL